MTKTATSFGITFNDHHEFTNCDMWRILMALRSYYDASEKFREFMENYDGIQVILGTHTSSESCENYSHFNIVAASKDGSKSKTLHAIWDIRYPNRIHKITYMVSM